MTDLMIIIPQKRLTGKLTIRKTRVSGVAIGSIWESANKSTNNGKAQRAINVKHEEAKKSEFRFKMLSKLLNKKDEAEAYISSTVIGFLHT
jgi:hypothetical protein